MSASSCSDGSMPRPRPPHLHRETSRHGKVVWYVRVGHGPRIRLGMGPGQPGFDTAYRAALAGETSSERPAKASVGSIEWLIDRYRETSSWTDLSMATRRQREAILKQIITTAGKEPVRMLTRAAVVAGRDRRRDTPFQARHYLDTLKGLCRWAFEAGHIKVDPTEGVKRPKQSGRDGGFAVWTEADVAAYEARHPHGSRARLAFDVLRYTGLRRGDACRLGRPHVRDGIITIRTEKTGEVVTIRMAPALAASISVSPVGDLTYIAGVKGAPMVKEAFGTQFRTWCREAGIEKSAHGLRKLAATIAAENGATVAELEAMFGWSGGRMASLYTKSADRKRLGLSASAKLPGTPAEHPIPAPSRKVRD